MLLITNKDAESAMSIAECMEAAEEGFLEYAHGRALRRPKMEFFTPCLDPTALFDYNDMLGAVTLQPRQVTGHKLGYFCHRIKADIVSWVEHPDGRLVEEKYCMRPGNYCGLMLLFSTANAEPLAIIQDGYLQHQRVGAGAGIIAKYAAREDSHIVGMLGSGGMARTYLQAMCVARDVREARVYSPNLDHRRRYAREMSEELKIEVRHEDKPEVALKGADIVCVATNALRPVFSADWLEDGMHVASIKVRRELDPRCEERTAAIIRKGEGGQIKIDDPEREAFIDRRQVHISYFLGGEATLKKIPGEWRQADRHIVRGANVVTLTQILRDGARPRKNAKDITISESAGNVQGVELTSSAARLYELCREKGIGQPLPIDWFTECIKD